MISQNINTQNLKANQESIFKKSKLESDQKKLKD